MGGMTREQCHAWCSCPDLHWRPEGPAHRWRPGLNGCSHPRHDEPEVTVWGIAAYLPEPVNSARSWFWCTSQAGELVEHGWAASAREAVAAGGQAVEGQQSQRCDLVAAEGWRWLVEQERADAA